MSAPRITHWQVARFLWPYVRRHLGALLGMLVLLLLSTVATLAQPFFYKEAIDVVATGAPSDPTAVGYALWMVVAGVSCAALWAVFDQVAVLILGYTESAIMPQIDADVFGHVQRLSTGFHVNAFAGASARKIRRGVDAVENILDRVWFNFLPAVVITVGLTAVLAAYAPLIAVVMLVGMVLFTALSIGLNLILSRYHEWVDEHDTKISANAVDTLTGNALVKAFGAESREDTRHAGLLSEWRLRVRKTWSVGTVFNLIQFLALILIEGAVLLLAVQLWSRGEFTAGGFIVVTFYVGQLWARLSEIGRNLRDFLQNMAHCKEMVALSMQPLHVSDRAKATALCATEGRIVFERVGFRYDAASRWIYKDFSVEIRSGERVALVGHSGGGKSTFVKLLFRLYDTQEGAVRIDGQDISSITQESLRSSIALVSQDPILFHRTIAENIAYGSPGATPEDIERAAKLAHAHEFTERLPLGYRTLVGERGVKLSGGERQRVAIARAILADKPILVLDEATSSLDSHSEAFIQEGLERLMQGRTSIVIAHRLSTIKKADRILVIEDGHIVEEGPHDVLVKRESGAYRALYELQAGGFLGE